MEECLRVLQQAWSGEEFEYEGRTVRVTPPPATPGGPMLFYGGGSRAAARRAARFGMGFFAQTWAAGLEDTYRDECERLGQPAGMCVIPAPGTATTMFVADDVDRGVGADRSVHAARRAHVRVVAGRHGGGEQVDRGDDRGLARRSAAPTAYSRPEQAVDYVRAHGALALHPLCGGCPPELAWETLELVADKVLPALR